MAASRGWQNFSPGSRMPPADPTIASVPWGAYASGPPPRLRSTLSLK